MTEYVIEKGVPIPRSHARIGRTDKNSLKGTLRLMDVGDSLIPPNKRTVIGATIALVHREFPNRTYVTRAVEGGVRVWRVA